MTKNMSRFGTLFIDQVTNLDCAIFDSVSGIHGQSWHVGVELSGKLDEQGFVFDFSKLKKLVRQVLKDSIDHALVIPVSSKAVHFTEDEDLESWQLHARCRMSETDSEWTYQCPPGAVYPIRCKSINQPILEKEIARLLRHRLPDRVQEVKVTFKEEEAEKTAAFFRYTHGITHHEGLCQRLFHGHRSRVEVHVGDERRADLEHFVARDILGQSVHIASTNQILEGPQVEVGNCGPEGQFISLAYEAVDGIFRATIPADKVFVIEGETSIECIAHQVAREIKIRENIKATVKVRIFEGIGKGAIAEN